MKPLLVAALLVTLVRSNGTPRDEPAAANGQDLFGFLDADSDELVTPDELKLKWDDTPDGLFEGDDADSDAVISRAEFRGPRGSRGGHDDGELHDNNIVPITLSWLRDGADEWRFAHTTAMDAVTRTLELLFSNINIDWTGSSALSHVALQRLDHAVDTAATALGQFKASKPNPEERLLRPWVFGVRCTPLRGQRARPSASSWMVEEVVHLPLLQFFVELYILSRSAVVRSVLLQFCDEVIFPGVPAAMFAETGTSAGALGLLPSVMQLTMDLGWLDLTLLSHLSRAGHPTPALTLPLTEWSNDGSGRQPGSDEGYLSLFATEGARVVAVRCARA
jgi:hypothetical protein